MTSDPTAPGRRRETRDADDTSQPAWAKVSRYDRRAQVVAVDRLTETGTVKITFEVIDGRPFVFSPGHWVGIEEDVPGLGPRHSPYCIFSPPGDSRLFDILIRVFSEGPLAHHLASLRPGYPIHFRGPAGRSMLPKEPDTDLIMLATGVGISPFRSLCRHLLTHGDTRTIKFYWGLRLAEDVCLLDELDGLAARHRNFTYQISLSQPPPGWPNLRGRVTESVPPLLDRLAGKRFFLAGNGAMIEEMEMALSSLGVDRTFIHMERFFNIRHRPDTATMEAILGRFVAHDLPAGITDLKDLDRIFPLERDVRGRRAGPPR
jgi:ferredoxin-NADP reductase